MRLKTLGYKRESVTDPLSSHPAWDDSTNSETE